MAETLLNKIINKEIKVDLFIKWLLDTNPQEQYFGGVENSKCSRTEFLTYFLNFVHEEIPCLSKYESPQKPNICKRTEPLQNDKTVSKRRSSLLLHEDKYDINKSASYPPVLRKSSDGSNKVFERNQTISPQTYRGSSTPKVMKIQSDSIIHNAHISPISPLYRNQTNFWTPKNERHSFTNKSMEKGTPLCLGDFIINRKSSAKKKSHKNISVNELKDHKNISVNELKDHKNISANELNDESSRRIKPTSLSQVKTNCSFRKCDNSFNNFEDTKEVSVDSLNDSRNFLAEERLKILSRRDPVGNLTAVTSKKISGLNFKVEMEPDVDSVTNKNELDCLVEIYVSILKNCFVLNITNEIYFLISLLLARHFNDGKENTSTNSNGDIPDGIDFLNDEDRHELRGIIKHVRYLYCSDLFETVHNIVYFAVRCLESQIDVLKYYDKSTLNLLRQNRRLQAFSSSCAEKLGKISQKKSERVLELPDSNAETTVCFNSDTDNRDNFPTDSAFHGFRKQRDLFYEILRVWEKQRLVTGWDFATGLGGKIKGLFSLQNEPVTFIHFCRLFKAQLLSTCGRFEKEEGLLDMPFLSSIPNVDVDKLNRLTCRLTTKQSSNGINSVPLFNGHQEFYKDFIVIAANHTFNRHLCDTLVSEIVDLNDTKFSCTDLEEIDGSVDPTTRKSYVACLKSLRILAKFLGFVESLPYKSDCSGLSEKVLNFQISLRKELTPTFDVKRLLENCIKQHSIILTVPWVAKYLSMLDYVTLRLPYYISVYKILFSLHKNCDRVLGSKPNGSYNASLVKFCLGWLFELPHFPDSEYFNFCVGAHEDGIFCPKAKHKFDKERKLDDLDIVDQNILYVCCPFLEEIKRLLSSNALNGSVTAKHITPVTAVHSSNEMAKKKLEQQLEEAFFNGQPLSLRKTVEFVSERVASACVKHICSAVVPPFKKSALENLRSVLASWTQQHNINSPTREKSLKAALKSKITQMAQANLQSLKEKCDAGALDIMRERVPPSVANLLSVDVLPQTRDVCISITSRMCAERVRQWTNTHVTVAVFTKDFNSEMQRALCSESKRAAREKPVFLLPPDSVDGNHNEDATSAFHLLEKIKGLSMVILENSAAVDEKLVMGVLDEAYVTLTERSDVNECIRTSTCTLFVDVSLLLITHKPDVMVDEGLLKKFVKTWNCYSGKVGDLFKNLFSPRNVMLLAQPCTDLRVWETFASVTAFLLKEDVLTPEQFETQCTDFYRKEWDQGTLRNFARFVRKFLECHRRDGGNTDKFTLLLEFLSDFCVDLA